VFQLCGRCSVAKYRNLFLSPARRPPDKASSSLSAAMTRMVVVQRKTRKLSNNDLPLSTGRIKALRRFCQLHAMTGRFPGFLLPFRVDWIARHDLSRITSTKKNHLPQLMTFLDSSSRHQLVIDKCSSDYECHQTSILLQEMSKIVIGKCRLLLLRADRKSKLLHGRFLSATLLPNTLLSRHIHGMREFSGNTLCCLR